MLMAKKPGKLSLKRDLWGNTYGNPTIATSRRAALPRPRKPDAEGTQSGIELRTLSGGDKFQSSPRPSWE